MRQDARLSIAALVPCALLLCAAGCHKNLPPVARVDVQPRALTLAYPQLTTVHLTWNPISGLGDESSPELLVFVHLLDAKGQVERTFDHPFPGHWSEGAPVSDDVKVYQSAVAPPLAAGKYRLSIGLYDRQGKRWPLDGLGQDLGRREYVGAEVEVPAQPAGPRFTFSPTWSPVEPGSDRHVVARRWLSSKPGEIRLDEIAGPGTLWLALRIPPGDGVTEKLVLDDGGSNAPAVVVRGSCGGVETGVSGTGLHEIEMPVDGQGQQAFCAITLVPNFHLVPLQPEARVTDRSAYLENAAWLPGAGRNPAAAATPAAATPPPPPAPAKPGGS
ncbi:MAG TPA: hypothetical protein VHR45_05090 [Thermoanaerobaculia bacterium]|nr:hypothetical protein [Thermoanaerobaculia bacterium]